MKNYRTAINKGFSLHDVAHPTKVIQVLFKKRMRSLAESFVSYVVFDYYSRAAAF